MSNLLRVDPAYETLAKSGDTVYYGYAVFGTQDTDPKWSIQKVVITTNNVKQYLHPYGLPNTGSTSAYFLTNVIWDLRTGYTYI